MTIVRTDAPPATREIVVGFGAIGVVTVHEAQGRTGLMLPCMRPNTGARAVGAAVTVPRLPVDDWMPHVVAEPCEPGDTVIAAAALVSDAGYLGDIHGTREALAVKGLKYRRCGT